MNKRIRELAEQAELNLELQSLKVEKFAELIVRECAKVADEGLAEVTMKGPEWPSHYVKKHFGVEE